MGGGGVSSSLSSSGGIISGRRGTSVSAAAEFMCKLAPAIRAIIEIGSGYI
jgi:hypothetical protein